MLCPEIKIVKLHSPSSVLVVLTSKMSNIENCPRCQSSLVLVKGKQDWNRGQMNKKCSSLECGYWGRWTTIKKEVPEHAVKDHQLPSRGVLFRVLTALKVPSRSFTIETVSITWQWYLNISL